MNKPQLQIANTGTPVPDNNLVAAATAEEPHTEQLEQRRAAIKHAIETAADPLMMRIKEIRSELDSLEALVIENAARASDHLNTHVNICEQATIEAARLRAWVTDARKTQVEHASERRH